MHSSRSLCRPSLFALSLSITLSFSPSISSLSFSLPPTFLVSSSCISLPLSPSFFLFQRSCICFSPPLGITLFLSLSLSRDPSFLLHRIHLPRRTNDPVSFSRYVHPLVPSLFFSFSLSLSVPSHSVSLSPGWSTLFFHPSARLAYRSVSIALSSPYPLADSLSPMFIYRDRLVCRGVHHTRLRVSVYVQELARGTHQFRPRCISLCGAASFPGSSLLGVHTLVTLCARVRFERV